MELIGVIVLDKIKEKYIKEIKVCFLEDTYEKRKKDILKQLEEIDSVFKDSSNTYHDVYYETSRLEDKVKLLNYHLYKEYRRLNNGLSEYIILDRILYTILILFGTSISLLMHFSVSNSMTFPISASIIIVFILIFIWNGISDSPNK